MRPDKRTLQKRDENPGIATGNLGTVRPAHTSLKEIVRGMIGGVHAFAQHFARYRHHRLRVLQLRAVAMNLKNLRVEQIDKFCKAAIHCPLTHPPCHPHHPLQVMEAPAYAAAMRHCTHIPNPCLRRPRLLRSKVTSVRPSQTLRSHKTPTNATFVSHGSNTGGHAHAANDARPRH